jgi:hypothetical protein
MGFHNRNSAIRFREIDPYPSEDIAGGTVVEKVIVPWLEIPIGVIVSRPSDKPPDAYSWGRVRTLWYFIPVFPDDPILQSDTIVEDIHIRVRDYYRRIYDNRNAPRGTFVASADDCDIESEVIEWAGLTERWEQSGLGDRKSFWRDVLWSCSEVIIKTNEWEGGGPGLSGTWYTVRTMNPSRLREEIAEWFEILIEKDKKEQAEQQAAALVAAEKKKAKNAERALKRAEAKKNNT